MIPTSTAEKAIFAKFVLDLRSGELFSDSKKVRLQGQVFRLLKILLERSGEVVTREELQRLLWPEQTFVDFDQGVNKAIAKLRQALDENNTQAQLIETLPKVGYRFLPPVEWDRAPSSAPGPVNTALTKKRGIMAWHWVVAALLLVCGVFIARSARPPFNTPASLRFGPIAHPITTLKGREISPSFSPDGSQVVFGWNSGSTDGNAGFDLYVKVVGTENVTRLTSKPSEWVVPAWSPDGKAIAFARGLGSSSGIFSISARGGPETKIAQAIFAHSAPMSLHWSPDGTELAYADESGMYVLEIKTARKQPVRVPSQCVGAFAPAFAPNNQFIAFSCYRSGATFEVSVLNRRTGQTTMLSTAIGDPTQVTWSKDSNWIIYPSDGAINAVDLNGGKPQLINNATNCSQPTITHDGHLGFVAYSENVNIWRLDVEGAYIGRRQLLISSSKIQKAANISPDGQKIVFASDRSGAYEIWMSDVDGGNPVQLSDFHSFSGSATWSQDGSQVLFDSRVDGPSSLYSVDTSSRITRKVATPFSSASMPSPSVDGKWTYFRANEEPLGPIYKVPLHGGEPTLITATKVGGIVHESSDGKKLYYTAGYFNSPILVKSVESGEERPLLGMPSVRYPPDWVLVDTGIFFIERDPTRNSIGFFDFKEAKVTRHFLIDRPTEDWGGLAISPDHRWIAYSQVDEVSSDIMALDPVH